MASRRGQRPVAALLHAVRDEHEEELKAWVREKYHPEAIYEGFALKEAMHRLEYRAKAAAEGGQR